MAIRAPVRANNPAFGRPTPGMPFRNETLEITTVSRVSVLAGWKSKRERKEGGDSQSCAINQP